MEADLFAGQSRGLSTEPLASRMRPTNIDEYVGQEHLLSVGKPLRDALEHKTLHSMILWGPPGTGKTSLAKMLAGHCDAQFEAISAVMSGVKDVRAVVQKAQMLRTQGRACIFFVDEVHRFNKSQQDAFLPFVEDGTLLFIGATTENPSFEINNALLSRAKVYVLKRLGDEALGKLLRRALTDSEYGLGDRQLVLQESEAQHLISAADGDARRLLNFVELAASMADARQTLQLDSELILEVIGSTVRSFDKGGDYFYDQISALHKSVRGSSPDAALYWYGRMIDGGCDPLYVARRVVRMASEDIGNADPRGLQLALNAWDTQQRLGSPEGELAIAQAIVYLACAPKSNAVYGAYKEAMKAAKQSGSLEVPKHIRNAPTSLMKELGHGKEYHYAHDHSEGFVAGENYFPAELAGSRFYKPVDRGLEIKIGEKLRGLNELNESSQWHRYEPSDQD
ncbi:MAG: recombination factor protein RarA [Moraxellaceae bacterium]|nr:MAG: recombination factor protein RarA [Moraxellaceae bacterium]